MKPSLLRRAGAACVLLLAAALPHRLPAAAAVPDIRSTSFTAADFFSTSRVWTAHLRLTPEQFEQMQPKQGPPILPGTVLPEGESPRNGLAARRGIIFDEARGDLEIEGREFRDVSVRHKGNGTYFASAGTLKISLKVDLNEHVANQNLAGQTTLNFHSCVRDPGFMNEALAYRFYNLAGVPAPRVTYARVYLTVPGRHDRRYVGLFSVVEDIDAGFMRDRFPPGGGAIFKPASGLLLANQGTEWSAYQQRYDPKTALTEAQKNRMLEIIAFVNNASPEQFAARLGDYLDLELTAAYFATAVWLVNMDSPLHTGQNHYLYLRPDTLKLVYLPWDQDESWGQVVGTQAIRNNLSINTPWLRANPVLQRIFAAESFRKFYLLKLAELTLNHGRPEQIAAQVDELAALIRPAIKEESAHALEQFELAVAGKPMRHLVGIGLNDFLPIKAFVAARQPSVLMQLTER
jgi:hypothetical protein